MTSTQGESRTPIRWLVKAFAILGASGVALGAFGAHALKEIRTPQQLDTWKTATVYLLVHAVLGLLLSICAESESLKVQVPKTPLMLLLAGVILFSGSLYGLVLLQIGPLGAVAPVGGLMLISAWIALALRLRI